MDKETCLQSCIVEGLIIKLPDYQLDRKVYQEVAKSLELIGGKWKGGKIAGFVFHEDPTDLLAQIAGGESRNLKKEYQFYATPPAIADWLVQLADIKPDHKILEPSAGQGAIINAINRVLPEQMVYWCELMPLNQTFLKKISHTCYVEDDFINSCGLSDFDRIIANPPFSKNQDIDHIRKMYDCLKPGGRLVSIASNHWNTCNNRKEHDFQMWLKEVNASVSSETIKPGDFRESGTMIGMNIITINKPAELPKPNRAITRSINSATVNHLSFKDRMIADINTIISEATKNPFKSGDRKVTISQFLEEVGAKTPKQIAEKTADFIRFAGTQKTGVNSMGCIEFRDSLMNASYKVPDAASLPGFLLSLKRQWGDGVSHDPSTGIPDNYGRDFRNKLQDNVLAKRRLVQSKPDDAGMKKDREDFIIRLILCNDTNDIYYQCRNFILGSLAPKAEPIPEPAHGKLKALPAPEPIPIPAKVKEPEPKRPAPVKQQNIVEFVVVEYSERSIALFGDTKAIKDKLMELHGAFNRHLKYNDQPASGWVFSKKREAAIRQLITS